MATETAESRRGKTPTTVYGTYLRTDELLALQKPRGARAHPDELTFQVVHQTIELWWTITVEQLEAASPTWARTAGRGSADLRRAVSAQSVVMAARRQLESVQPEDFLVIRAGLGNGSGGESPGFRAIRHAPSYGTRSPPRWSAKLSLVDLYADSHAHGALFDVAEALTDFDEQFHLFRAAHLKLAQRNLGLKAIGTGGTPMPGNWSGRCAICSSRRSGRRATN